MKALSMLGSILKPPPQMRSIVLSFGIVAAALGCTQADRFYAADDRASAPSFAPIVQEVMPAVVNISAIQRMSKAAVDPEETGAGRAEEAGIARALPPEVQQLEVRSEWRTGNRLITTRRCR